MKVHLASRYTFLEILFYPALFFLAGSHPLIGTTSPDSAGITNGMVSSIQLSGDALPRASSVQTNTKAKYNYKERANGGCRKHIIKTIAR
jgi:hypothetical protein